MNGYFTTEMGRIRTEEAIQRAERYRRAAAAQRRGDDGAKTKPRLLSRRMELLRLVWRPRTAG